MCLPQEAGVIHIVKSQGPFITGGNIVKIEEKTSWTSLAFLPYFIKNTRICTLSLSFFAH